VESAFCLSEDTVVDDKLRKCIGDLGFSRVPVYAGGARGDVRGFILVSLESDDRCLVTGIRHHPPHHHQYATYLGGRGVSHSVSPAHIRLIRPHAFPPQVKRLMEHLGMEGSSDPPPGEGLCLQEGAAHPARGGRPDVHPRQPPQELPGGWARVVVMVTMKMIMMMMTWW
jgi:hypothetical protein